VTIREENEADFPADRRLLAYYQAKTLEATALLRAQTAEAALAEEKKGWASWSAQNIEINIKSGYAIVGHASLWDIPQSVVDELKRQLPTQYIEIYCRGPSSHQWKVR